MAVSLYTSRVVLQMLGVDDYGVYNVVGGIVLMISIVSNTMASTTTRFLSVELGRSNVDKFNRVFNTSLYIHILLAICVIIIAETLGLWFMNTYLNIPQDSITAAQWVYQFSIIVVVMHIIQSPFTGAIVSHEKMGAYAYFDLAYVFLKLGIVFLLPLFTTKRLIVYSGMLAVVTILIFFINLIYCSRNIKGCKVSNKLEKGVIKSMISFNVWSMVSSAAFAGRTQGINMVLNIFFGIVANTAVGIATQVMSAVESFAGNIIAAITPPLMKSVAQGDSKSVIVLLFSGSKLMTLLMIAISTPIILETEYIISLWLGTIPAYVLPFTRLTLIGLYFIPAYRLFDKCVMATGNIRRMTLTNSILFLSIIPLSIVAYKVGLPAPTAYLISIIIAPLILLNNIWIASKYITELKLHKYITSVILPCFVVLIITFGVTMSVSLSIKPSVFHLFATFLLSVITCSASAYILALDNKEKTFIKQSLRKIAIFSHT